MIIDKLEELMQLQENIKLDDLEYTAERGKRYNFKKCNLPIVFLTDIRLREGNLLLESADKEQSLLLNELKDTDKG